MRSTFKLLFYINRNKVKSDGTTAVLCRISIDGKKSAVTTGVYCKPGDWDSKKCEIKTARENNRLAAFRSRLEEAYGNLLRNQGVVTAELLKTTVSGANSVPEYLLQAGEVERERLRVRSKEGRKRMGRRRHTQPTTPQNILTIKKEPHVKTVYFRDPTKENIEAAAKIIRDGGLLAIPTETVYGLGADALNEDAVLRIFLAKGRPQDNPLIIHVPDSSWLERYCENVPPEAYALAEKFWPGPLTMILPRKPIVPLRTTGGLETVGVRCPNHPITRAVIAAADVPIAAPSGNTSGRPSPTCIADMIEDMDGKIEGMFDGGPCAVGVESTIIDLTCTPPRLLRPGGLPLEALEAVLGHVDVDKAVVSLLKAGERPKAPGMKYRHYAPKAPVTVVTGDPAASAQYIQAHLPEGAGVICFTEYKVLFPGRSIHDLGPAADKEEQARRVFDALREFDHEAVTEIYAQCPDTAGLGLAVANRLKKAAGFHVIEV